MTYTHRIGYCKFGRSLTLNTKFGFQGDAEAPQLLERLARRNPNVEWVIVGRTTEGKIDMPNVVNTWDALREPWREFTKGTNAPYSIHDKHNITNWFGEHTRDIWTSLDGCVVHAGQHGTTNSPIPFSGSTWKQYATDPKHVTHPHDWSTTYGGSIVKGLNMLGDVTDGKAPIAWLITDPRNYLKARDIKWPTGLDDILAQYDWWREQRHERFLDPRTPKELGFGDYNKPMRNGELWFARHTYRYGGLELMILPDDWRTWGPADFEHRLPAGMATTSFHDGRNGKEPRRSELVRDIFLPVFPDGEVFGKWDKGSAADVPEGTVKLNEPHEFPGLLNRWRVTLSLPAIGTSWTVAKPFQCFAARVACFLYGRLDDQGWILPTARSQPQVNGRQHVGKTHQVADGLWSIRDDWTEQDMHLARWLRVDSAEEFKLKAYKAAASPEVWTWIVNAQRDLLERRWTEAFVETEIERKLGLAPGAG